MGPTPSLIADLFISAPPYVDAVKYEEITDFFIAWLRKNPRILNLQFYPTAKKNRRRNRICI